jgi:hypothetical protein
MVSCLSFSNVATSCTMAFSSSGGKVDEDMMDGWVNDSVEMQ